MICVYYHNTTNFQLWYEPYCKLWSYKNLFRMDNKTRGNSLKNMLPKRNFKSQIEHLMEINKFDRN